MATTSIWSIKNNLKNSIDYIINPEKTFNEDFGKFFEKEIYQDYNFKNEKTHYVSGINCDEFDPYSFMKDTKDFHHKNDGILGFHAYQSFKEGEVTPEIAHEIGVKLAKEMFNDYEVVVATHLNTNHIHNHFIINSVSRVDGKKYNNNRTNLAKLRHISDSFCEEYGLSTLEEQEHYNNTYKYKVLNNDYYKMIKEDVDNAINESLVLDQFKNRLKTLGYKIEQRYNKISVYIEGKEKVRLEKIFGPEYSTENIINRFNTSHYKPLKKLNNKSIYNLFLEDTKSPFKGIRQLYLYYCYLLGVFPKKYSNQHLSHEMRLEAKKLDKISEEAKFLSNNNIETIEDLDLIENKYLNELYILKDTREKLQRKYHRTKDEETKKEISSKLESLKHKIKELYNIKNYISDIRTRIPKIEEQIKDLDNNMPKSYTRENVK